MICKIYGYWIVKLKQDFCCLVNLPVNENIRVKDRIDFKLKLPVFNVASFILSNVTHTHTQHTYCICSNQEAYWSMTEVGRGVVLLQPAAHLALFVNTHKAHAHAHTHTHDIHTHLLITPPV